MKKKKAQPKNHRMSQDCRAFVRRKNKVKCESDAVASGGPTTLLKHFCPAPITDPSIFLFFVSPSLFKHYSCCSRAGLVCSSTLIIRRLCSFLPASGQQTDVKDTCATSFCGSFFC